MAKRNSESLQSLPDPKDVIDSLNVARKLTALLNEAHGLKATIDKAQTSLDSIKAEITGLQLDHNLPAFRAGRFCCITSEVQGRKTLSRELLIDNGVDPDIIQASMKEGLPYFKTEFPTIDE